MSANQSVSNSMITPRLATVGFAALLLVEFAFLGAVFTRFDSFQCFANWPRSLCLTLRDMMIAGYGILGALALLMMLFPSILQPDVAVARRSHKPLILNAAGVILALLPVFFLKDGAGYLESVLAFVFWIIDGFVILGGALWALATL